MLAIAFLTAARIAARAELAAADRAVLNAIFSHIGIGGGRAHDARVAAASARAAAARARCAALGV